MGPGWGLFTMTISNKLICQEMASIFALAAILAAATISPAAQNYKFKVLHTFHGKEGKGPSGLLALDAAGNLYGTTEAGGTGKCGDYGCGTAFKLNKSGQNVWVHSFDITDGEEPLAGMAMDASGNLFGTTSTGGRAGCDSGCGTVFKLNNGGAESLLYRFKGQPDGYWPGSLPAEDKSGAIYVTTAYGGKYRYGAIVKIAGGKETVLYSFTGGSDGCEPWAGAILDGAGNLYGVTAVGGLGVCDLGYGVVYELTTSGNLIVLHDFSGSDGAYPGSVLLFDTSGNIYGTTNGGGNYICGQLGCGVVFKLSPNGNGTWTEATLYDFCSLSGCDDGQEPDYGPLVRDAEGNIFGTTYFGGTSRNCGGGQEGCGVVFELDSSGQETVLYSFTGGSDGAYPAPGLATDRLGNLYGVAEYAGDAGCNAPNGCGTVFKLTR